MSKHQLLFQGRLTTILQSAKSQLQQQRQQQQQVDPVPYNKLLRTMHLSCSSGWLLNSVRIDTLISDLESVFPSNHHDSAPSAERGRDDRERQYLNFMVESMNNNANLLKSEIGTNMSDVDIVKTFKGYKKETDLEIPKDSKDLGSGAFGQVKVAKYKGMPCAVKIPKSQGAAQEVLRESAMLLKLNPSPHIIGVIGLCSMRIDTGEVMPVTIMELLNMSLKDRIYASNMAIKQFTMTRMAVPSAVLESVDSSDLVKRTINDGLIPWITKVKIARDIIMGVAYMHSCSIIHGDLKPGNLLLDAYDNVKLCDVGASASIQSIARRVVAYTPGYAPQKVVDGGEADFNNDVYAFGQLLIDIAGANRAPRLPSVIERISVLCKSGNIDAAKAVDLMLNLYGDFDEWDKQMLSIKDLATAMEMHDLAERLVQAKLHSSTTGSTRITDYQDDSGFKESTTTTKSFLAQFESDSRKSNASGAPMAPPRGASIMSAGSGAAGSSVMSSGSGGGSRMQGQLQVLAEQYPDAHEFWMSASPTGDSAKFSDLVQLLMFKADEINPGSSLETERLRANVDYSNSGQVSLPIFLAAVKSTGSLDKLVAKYSVGGQSQSSVASTGSNNAGQNYPNPTSVASSAAAAPSMATFDRPSIRSHASSQSSNSTHSAGQDGYTYVSPLSSTTPSPAPILPQPVPVPVSSTHPAMPTPVPVPVPVPGSTPVAAPFRPQYAGPSGVAPQPVVINSVNMVNNDYRSRQGATANLLSSMGMSSSGRAWDRIEKQLTGQTYQRQQQMPTVMYAQVPVSQVRPGMMMVQNVRPVGAPVAGAGGMVMQPNVGVPMMQQGSNGASMYRPVQQPVPQQTMVRPSQPMQNLQQPVPVPVQQQTPPMSPQSQSQFRPAASEKPPVPSIFDFHNQTSAPPPAFDLPSMSQYRPGAGGEDKKANKLCGRHGCTEMIPGNVVFCSKTCSDMAAFGSNESMSLMSRPPPEYQSMMSTPMPPHSNQQNIMSNQVHAKKCARPGCGLMTQFQFCSRQCADLAG
ncbi:hypothetical protein HDU76_011061 [Blyttiomyces sp. JEL0837]|nr:hypothetical protein HDU76_011061 [Blyttiomyces sp. JEL0837]